MIARVGLYAYGVYTIIAMHQDYETGLSFPGVKRIRKLTGMGFSTIAKCINLLEKGGYITIERRRARDRDGKEYGNIRNYYTIIDHPSGRKIYPDTNGDK